jgi:flagellar hook assembly protein FlgD
VVGSGNARAGSVAIRWNGRDSRGHLVYGGRYLVRVRAQTPVGLAELTQPVAVRRG